MHIYGLKSCDSCKAALKELRAAGHAPVFVDVRADGVPPATLARFVSVLGDAVVNRKSKTWREMPEADRVLAPAELIARYPTVMKRPVIEVGDSLYLGWGAETRAALLG